MVLVISPTLCILRLKSMSYSCSQISLYKLRPFSFLMCPVFPAGPLGCFPTFGHPSQRHQWELNSYIAQEKKSLWTSSGERGSGERERKSQRWKSQTETEKRETRKEGMERKNPRIFLTHWTEHVCVCMCMCVCMLKLHLWIKKILASKKSKIHSKQTNKIQSNEDLLVWGFGFHFGFFVWFVTCKFVL